MVDSFVLNQAGSGTNRQLYSRVGTTDSSQNMRGEVPVKIKLRFVAHDESSKCEVSEAGSKCHLDLTLKVLSFSI